MTAEDAAALDDPTRRLIVSEITIATVREALRQGFRDFRAAPLIGSSVGLFFAAGGWIVFYMVEFAGLIYLAYPTAAGFALLGPFTATVLYEVSMRLAAGERVAFGATFSGALKKGRDRLSWLPMITLFGFIIWLDVAAALYAIFFGVKSPEIPQLFIDILTTPTGLLFLVVGNAIGAFFAVMLFSISVMSYPLLMDRGTDPVTAMMTSVKAVKTNPVPLIGYGFFVAATLAASTLTGFLALLVVMPLLGHTTWHLYKATVHVEDVGPGL